MLKLYYRLEYNAWFGYASLIVDGNHVEVVTPLYRRKWKARVRIALYNLFKV